MNVIVNDKPTEVEHNTSIVTLLNQFNIVHPMTIVEINRTVIAKDEWHTHIVNDGDRIEIIQLMGGG
ncbi:MAG: sulfur carrier protein ThiS [Deltaproteobacteria bacterium]|nr:sulfur carrier protein ThiS [Deltaproteobacteria bacterium]MBN2672174.1 sulfur carrier protein ThiS [Deltaproteobacteria bacterium]